MPFEDFVFGGFDLLSFVMRPTTERQKNHSRIQVLVVGFLGFIPRPAFEEKENHIRASIFASALVLE